MPHDFNRQIIEEFRGNRGRVGGDFDGARLLLLNTTGARSGLRRTTPLAYLPDGTERVLVIASAAGSTRHPDWFHNLLAHPRVTVENGLFVYEADANVLEGAERDRVFARAVEADPAWADYQARTTRTIPVVALEAVDGGPPNAGSLGATLVLLHDAFRRELAFVRKEIAESGPGLGAQLRLNCVTLCQGLRFHHTGEDAGIFPVVAERFPELAPTVERLRAEHRKIGLLLDRLREVVSDDTAELPAVVAEVDRLVVELEAHLTYEEEQLVPVLDV